MLLLLDLRLFEKCVRIYEARGVFECNPGQAIMNHDIMASAKQSVCSHSVLPLCALVSTRPANLARAPTLSTTLR